jgi:murein L,D-transpeptidase YcbB/YkuD
MDNLRIEIGNSLQKHLRGTNQNIVREMYAQIGNSPIWLGAGDNTKSSRLIHALKNPLFNYKNKGFNQRTIGKLFYELDNAQTNSSRQTATYARLDVVLTNAFVRLIRFVVQGDVDWGLVQKKLKALKKSDDIKSAWEMAIKAMPNSNSILNATRSGNIYGYLSSLLPMESRYRKLVKILLSYRGMRNFSKVPYIGKVLKIGNSGKTIEKLKRRLQISGDYPRNAPINTSFGKTLRTAVIKFQKRYLLKITGMVDSTMIYYLNRPKLEKIQAIITNLDKTKLYPKSFESEHIEVNIPDFNLRYYKNNQKIMKMGLIVGRIDRPTPLFHSAVRYMVLNPTWTIPDNLIKRDLIHVLRENPAYLQENNIHVFSGNNEIQVTQSMLDPYEHSKKRVPYRFVQFPGDNNALGRVKFMFPNKYAVYLHDTDNKTLFPRRYKVYSSGCMRVEKPFKLMHTLLQHTAGYSSNSLESIFATNKPKTIKLNRSIPVHILYFTVYEENGLAYFKHDIYLYDKIIQESAEGYKKSTFSIPSKRLIQVKKRGEKPLSN